MYVDGFLLAVRKKDLPAYRRLAQKAGKVWREHGAVDYKECVGDDLNLKWGLSFNRTAKVKRGEVPVFSFIVYKSRAQRDRVNAKVMKDPRMDRLITGKPPFDVKRMSCGGFKVIVDA